MISLSPLPPGRSDTSSAASFQEAAGEFMQTDTDTDSNMPLIVSCHVFVPIIFQNTLLFGVACKCQVYPTLATVDRFPACQTLATMVGGLEAITTTTLVSVRCQLCAGPIGKPPAAHLHLYIHNRSVYNRVCNQDHISVDLACDRHCACIYIMYDVP